MGWWAKFLLMCKPSCFSCFRSVGFFFAPFPRFLPHLSIHLRRCVNTVPSSSRTNSSLGISRCGSTCCSSAASAWAACPRANACSAATRSSRSWAWRSVKIPSLEPLERASQAGDGWSLMKSVRSVRCQFYSIETLNINTSGDLLPDSLIHLVHIFWKISTQHMNHIDVYHFLVGGVTDNSFGRPSNRAIENPTYILNGFLMENRLQMMDFHGFSGKPCFIVWGVQLESRWKSVSQCPPKKLAGYLLIQLCFIISNQHHQTQIPLIIHESYIDLHSPTF